MVAMTASAVIAGACRSTPATSEARPESAAASDPGKPRPTAEPGATLGETRAAVGQPAPDFTLRDLDGKTFRLADHKGKTVILEWFNPECPFVKNSHTKGSLVGTAKRHGEKGVVWLAVNSAAPGKQGHGLEASRAGQSKFSLSHPILLDESGDVGRLYGATRTPELFVIDPKGTLVYRGAIDNSPDGEGGSPTDGKLVNYVDAALADLAAARPVAKPRTEPYGCTVKYAR
jgi:hypothetical protein